MAELDFREVLTTCPMPDECFASDPGAFGAMLFMDDIVLRAEWSNVERAANKAARDGQSLEDTTYATISIERGKLEDGETRRIGDLEEDDNRTSTRGIGFRVAKCAYACGRAATCPLEAYR